MERLFREARSQGLTLRVAKEVGDLRALGLRAAAMVGGGEVGLDLGLDLETKTLLSSGYEEVELVRRFLKGGESSVVDRSDDASLAGDAEFDISGV